MAQTVIAGVHEERTAAQTAARFPGAAIGREFISGQISPRDLRPEFDRLAAPWLAIGGVAYISFKPIPADVAAGGWTGHLRNLGAWLADNPGAKVIVHHEPENDLPGSTYATMFNRCRAEIKAGWQGAIVAYCAMSYQWRPGGKAAVDGASWARVVADEYLCDVYSGKSFPDTTTLPNHPGFVGWLNAIVQPRLNVGEAVIWGLGERGFQSTISATRAATIRAEKDWLVGLARDYPTKGNRSRPPAVYLAWNTPGREKDPAWVFDTAAEQAMAELVAAFAPTRAGTPQPPAEPDPVDPPPTEPVPDRYQEGYNDGYTAGGAARESDVVLARQEGFALGETSGRRSGALDAYHDAAGYAQGKAAQLAA